MKRFFYVFTAILLVVISIFTLSACNKKKKVAYDLSQNISYAETNKYAGASDDFRVTVTAGIREKLFIADGTAQNVGEFAQISVVPLKTNLLKQDYTYTLLGEGCELNGSLTRDVVTHNYIAAVELGECKNKLTALKLKYGENEVEIPLVDQLSDKITYQQALEIAKCELTEQIEGNITDGKLNREITVKLIRDKRNPDSPYYWYVSFIAADNGYWAVLLDPTSGEVVTKKI